MSILSDGGTKTYKRLLQKSGLGGDDSEDDDESAGGAGEGDGLLSAEEQADNREDGEGEPFARRDSRSRSQSVRRKVKWYKRPSPMW